MDGYSTVLELGASFADHFFCTATGRALAQSPQRTEPLSGVRDADGHFYVGFDLQRAEHGGKRLDAVVALI
jgi:hypothetical protein